MAASTGTISILAPNLMKVSKIKLKKGQQVSKGTLVCLYTTDSGVTQKFKSNDGGIVAEIIAKEGDVVEKGCVLFTVHECSHPTVMKDMCADCGADLRIENSTAGNRKEDVSASVAMVHSIPELIVSEKLAQELGKADEERLLKTRKLVLLVDLDQTLIHTTNDNIPPKLKDVHHYQMWHGNQMLWYHTRLRPQTKTFLENISKLYELHICTFGSRMYAHTIARILDPEGKYFSHRILSRDECFNAQSKTANLKALFPCGDAMVCIIDDREDVWHFSPNLVHVKPYRFFQGTADINAPPGLTKTEHDSETLVHRVRKVSQSSTGSQDDKSEDKAESETETTATQSGLAHRDEQSVKNVISETENVATQSITGSENENQEGSVDHDTENGIDTLGTENSSKLEENDLPKSVEAKEEKEVCKDIEIEAGDITNDDKKMDTCENTSNLQVTETVSGKCSVPEEKEVICDSEIADTPEQEKPTDKTKTDENDEDEMIEWDDEDDYLFYLEEILKTIHSTFYDFYDQLKGKESGERGDEKVEKPSLKTLIPYIKKKVLKGCNILFSGVIPTNMTPEKSKAYIVARSLGANIHTELRTKQNETDLKEFTTHLVAAKHGTNKVRSAMKYKHVIKVNQDWLWSCVERWERVEEVLFPIPVNAVTDDQGRDSPDVTKAQISKSSSKRKRQQDSGPDGHEGKRKRKVSPSNDLDNEEEAGEDVSSDGNDKSDQDPMDSEDVLENTTVSPNNDNGSEKKGSRKFSMSYNPMLAFSDDDLAYMDKEVEDEMEDEDQSSEDEDARASRMRNQVLKSRDCFNDSSSEDSLSGNMPRGWGLKHKMSPKSSSEDEMKGTSSPGHEVSPEYESETDQDKFDKIMDAFGPETENSDEEYEESIGSADEEIAEAVMKEFLS